MCELLVTKKLSTLKQLVLLITEALGLQVTQMPWTFWKNITNLMGKKHLSNNNKHINIYHNTHNKKQRDTINYWRCGPQTWRRTAKDVKAGDRHSAVLKQIKNMLDMIISYRSHKGNLMHFFMCAYTLSFSFWVTLPCVSQSLICATTNRGI